MVVMLMMETFLWNEKLQITEFTACVQRLAAGGRHAPRNRD
jgi:hypothetical protein